MNRIIISFALLAFSSFAFAEQTEMPKEIVEIQVKGDVGALCITWQEP